MPDQPDHPPAEPLQTPPADQTEDSLPERARVSKEGPAYLLKAIGRRSYTPEEDEELLEVLLKLPLPLLEDRLAGEHDARFDLLHGFPELRDPVVGPSHPQRRSLSVIDRSIRLHERAIAQKKSAADTHTSAEGCEATQAEKPSSCASTPRAEIDAFLSKVEKECGTKVSRKAIWTVAGYTDATQFERFQRDCRATPGTVAKFRQVLRMDPHEFIRRLKNRPPPSK